MAASYETDESSASSVGSLGQLLSAAPRSPVPSDYALRYGIADDKPGYLSSRKRSGLTPIEPPDPKAPLSPQSQKIARHLERYQRANLGSAPVFYAGFTTWELQDCGALIKEDAKANNLWYSTPLHPLFQQTRWKDGIIPLPQKHLYP